MATTGGILNRAIVQVRRPHRNLSVAPRNIQDVGRLAEAGDGPADLPHQSLSRLDGTSELRCAGREVGMVQIVGLYAGLDHGSEQSRQRLRIIIDAFQQHSLAQYRDPGVDDPGAGRARFGREFAGVIGVQRSGDRRP